MAVVLTVAPTSTPPSTRIASVCTGLDPAAKYRVRLSNTVINTFLPTPSGEFKAGIAVGSSTGTFTVSLDLAGQGNQWSTIATQVVTVAVAPPPDAPPVISNVVVSDITQTSVRFRWHVSELATGTVYYRVKGTTPWSKRLPEQLTPDYVDHDQTLAGLTAGTVYQFYIESKDSIGQSATTAVAEFTTLGAPPPPPPPPPPTDGYPADRTLAYVATPTMAVPAYLTPVPVTPWGTQLIRVSNTNGWRNAYSRKPIWNCDGTRALLDSGGTTGRLLHGTTFADLGPIAAPSGAVWSNVDPDLIYGQNWDGAGSAFVRYFRLSTMAETRWTIPGYTGISIGDGEGVVSNDDHLMALMAQDSAGAQFLLSVDPVAKTVLKAIPLPSRPNWCSVSQSGKYVVVGWGDNSMPDGGEGTGRYHGKEVFDPQLNFLRQITTTDEHSDLGVDFNGDDVLVHLSPTVTSKRLKDGYSLPLLPAGSAFASGHVSCRNIKRPGWCVLSDYDGTSTKPGADQVVALKFDGSGTVEPFTHAHHRGDVYANDPFACPSPDGKLVGFSSDWIPSGNVYAYVAGLTVAAPAPPPANSVQLPPSIDSTGATDVTSALLNFFASVPAQTTILFKPTGLYKVDGNLNLAGRTGFYVDQQGAKIFPSAQPADSGAELWTFRRCSDVRLANAVLDGHANQPGVYMTDVLGTGFEWQHAIAIYGGSGFDIGGVTTSAFVGDGLYISDDGGIPAGVNVHDTTFRTSGRCAIAVIAGKTVRVDRVTADGIGMASFDLEPNNSGQTIDDVVFSDIIIKGKPANKGGSVAFGLGGPGAHSNVTIQRVDATAADWGLYISPGPTSPRAKNFSVLDCQGLTSTTYSNGAILFFRDVDGLHVHNVTHNVKGSDYLIKAQNCTGRDISNNHWTGGSGELVVV